MRISLDEDELHDLGRQLRYLFVRELQSAGFVSDNNIVTPGVSHLVTWRFDSDFDLESYTYIYHIDTYDGPTLIEEAMRRVESDEPIAPRSINEKYITKLRDAVRKIAKRNVIEWKRAIEIRADMYITKTEPLSTYAKEKILFKLWI